MAKKTKRQAASRRRPQPQTQQRPQAPRTATPPPTGGPIAVPAAQDGAVDLEDAERLPLPPPGPGMEPPPPPVQEKRRVGRVDPATAAVRRRPAGRPGSTAADFEPLDPEDAAIPFDRVPYVPADLRRVGIMAALMIVLIIVAAVLVSTLVK